MWPSDMLTSSPTVVWHHGDVVVCHVDEARKCNPCFLSVVLTLFSREVKHENEALNLRMKQEESCGLRSLR